MLAMNRDLPDDWFRSGVRPKIPGDPGQASADSQGRSTGQYQLGHVPPPATHDGTDRHERVHSGARQHASNARTIRESATPESHAVGVLPENDAEPDGSDRARRVRTTIVLVLGLAGVLALGMVLGGLWQDRTTTVQQRAFIPPARALSSAPAPTAPQSPVGSRGPVGPYLGTTEPVRPQRVSASCMVARVYDGSGAPIRYDAVRVLDPRQDTVCSYNGDGVNTTMRFTFAQGTALAGVGLVNGYTKTSANGADLYPQYRRVLALRWTMPDGSWFDQRLTDNCAVRQEVAIPVTDAGGVVTLTILDSSEPGDTDPGRDAGLISEVRFMAPAK